MKKPLVISLLLAIAPLSFAATHNLDGRTLGDFRSRRKSCCHARRLGKN